MDSARSGETNPDVHAWCFVPSSFRLIMHDLHALGFTPLRELDFQPTIGCEFFVTLSRKGKGPDRSRLQMQCEIESELQEKSGRSDRWRQKMRLFSKK
jgi:hypothetical protein